MVRGTTKELGPDKWRVRLDVGKTPEGGRKQASKVVKGGRRVAEKALAALIKYEEKLKK